MKVFSRGIGLAVGFLALCAASAAGAQENLDSGKTAAQLFASDCAICHKSPQGLAKSGRLFGLDNFLREHYTASRESASAIAKYLEAAGNAPAAPAKRPAKRNAKGDDKAKAAEKKPADAKGSDAKPAESKPAEAKPSEAKPAEPKPSEPKPAESPKSD